MKMFCLCCTINRTSDVYGICAECRGKVDNKTTAGRIYAARIKRIERQQQPVERIYQFGELPADFARWADC
jgi:hypothetical protein